MKHLKILIAGLGIVLAYSLFSSCNKTTNLIAGETTDFNNKAIVQVAVATAVATRNYVYVDNNQVTGALLGAGSIFPASGTGVGFTVDGGLRSFLVRDTLATSPQPAFNFAENLNAASHYTIFLYDSVISPKQKTVKDNIIIPTDTTARIRFANFIYNPTAVPNVDVFSYYLNTNIFTNVPVTGVTDFIGYPSRLTLDTLYIREAGTMNLLLKTTMTVLTPKRNYTFLYRGSHRGTKTFTLYVTR